MGDNRTEDARKKVVASSSSSDELVKLYATVNEQQGILANHAKVLGSIENIFRDVIERIKRVESRVGYAQLIWKIDNFKARLQAAQNGDAELMFSPAFQSHPCGYRMAASIALNGDRKVKGKFVSLFFCLLKGEYDSLLDWPYSHPVTFSLMDLAEKRTHVDFRMNPNPVKENIPFLGRPTASRNPSIGCSRFAPLDLLKVENSRYVDKDDNIFIRVQVHVSQRADGSEIRSTQSFTTPGTSTSTLR